MTLFKNCQQNFYPSKNMALVNGGYLQYGHEEILLKFLFSEKVGQILK